MGELSPIQGREFIKRNKIQTTIENILCLKTSFLASKEITV